MIDAPRRPGRRRDQWIAIADEIKEDRAIVVACASFFCANYSPLDVANIFDLSERRAIEIARAVRPSVRKQWVRGL